MTISDDSSGGIADVSDSEISNITSGRYEAAVSRRSVFDVLHLSLPHNLFVLEGIMPRDIQKLGYTEIMGPALREYVKKCLFEDLSYYLKNGQKTSYSDCVYDWSETCIEGHRTSYLDGEIENFSGVKIMDTFNNLIVEGWMEFIEEADKLHVFWLFLDGGPKYDIEAKKHADIPLHIWKILKNNTKKSLEKF